MLRQQYKGQILKKQDMLLIPKFTKQPVMVFAWNLGDQYGSLKLPRYYQALQ